MMGLRFVYGVLAMLAMSTLSQTVDAAPESKMYTIDPAHTRVLFFVDHLGLTRQPGFFNNIQGRIDFHFQNVASSTVDVSIDATSLTMGHAVLDRKLQGKEYFNTAQFPVITFKSTAIHKNDVNTGVMKGELSLRGVVRPVTLDVVFNGRKWNRYSNAEFAGFTATGTLRRSDFGMRSMLPDIGDVVRIQIQVEAKEVRPIY